MTFENSQHTHYIHTNSKDYILPKNKFIIQIRIRFDRADKNKYNLRLKIGPQYEFLTLKRC